MFEQDIELTRLLLEKVAALNSQGADLRDELDRAEAELAETQQVREERKNFQDVLARAAELLDRADLQVESPATTEQEERVNALRGQLDEIEQAILTHRQVIDDLESTAPELVAVARASASTTEGSAAQESSSGHGDEFGVVEMEEEPGEDDNTEQGTVGPVNQDDVPEPNIATADGYERPAVSQLFNLEELRIKETFTYGKNAAFAIDATSVLARVPHYDRHFRALNEADISGELISDIDRLSHEITGDFHVFFAGQHHASVEHGSQVTIHYASSEGDGGEASHSQSVIDIIAEFRAEERVVCLVSGDADLAEAVAGPEIYIIPLSEFFKT